MIRHAHRPAPPWTCGIAAAACEEPYQSDQEECANGEGMLSIAPWEGKASAEGSRGAGASGDEWRRVGGLSRGIWEMHIR